MEIFYLEDDDDDPVPQSVRPRIPPPQESGHAYRPPVSRGAGDTAWFICTNDACSKAGFVASGKHTPTHVVKKGRCGDCRGLGIRVDEDGDQCETCGGSGRKVLKAEDIVLPVPCPTCRR